MNHLFAALLLASIAGGAAAQAADTVPVNRAALSFEHSSLDRGLGDWRAATLQLGRHWSQRQLVEADVTQTRRFGQDDTEWGLGGAVPLSPSLTASGRLTNSPTHRVLARHSAAAQLQYEFRRAWLLHGGIKHTRFDATDVEQASLMLEHYFGDFSALAGVHAARAFGERTEAYELRATWHYAEGSSAGVIASNGDEAAQVGPGTIALARVRSLALVGRHAVNPTWTLRWGLHHVRQGSFHTRKGASLGVQAAF
jgi:YaiO family outer membrane protein